ncbi:hypothetical protein [Marinicrinis sediminis]|uniref:DUF4175 domain-containing protein n=1 Tax=Marinicrinis sediminis TaxID=1652465 RepID=A0ABW5R5B6_9BACL
MSRVWSILLYSMAISALLAAFSLIPSLFKYVCSIGALLLGFRFFSIHDEWRDRIWFFGAFIIGFLLWVSLYAALAIVFDWPLPEGARIDSGLAG